jgi:RNA polymerase sigma-70 factor (ECF subfamily)
MSSDERGSVTREALLLNAEDALVREQAAARIWERFQVRLVELARRRLSLGIRVREDEQDVVQSMFRSFFAMQQKEGRAPLDSRDDVWRLLVWMTLCKASAAAQRHHAQRRDVRKERALDLPAGADETIASWLGEPSDRAVLDPRDAAVGRDEFNRLMAALPEPLRAILAMRLEGWTNAEIAARIDRTERTVELKLQLVRELLGRDLEGRRPSD